MAMAEATPTILPVPTVAPRAVAVAAKALLLLKIFPKVDFIINPAFLRGKNPVAKVKKAPAPRTGMSRAGPHIRFDKLSKKEKIPCV